MALGSGWTPTPEQGFGYDVTKDTNVPKADNTQVRGQLVDLIGQTTQAYNLLMQAGRDNDAYALRDAMERFSRTGSQAGVSPWARTQAINDLRARMAATARTLQGTLTSQALDKHAALLGQIANLDATTFNQQMAIANQQQQVNATARGATAGQNQLYQAPVGTPLQRQQGMTPQTMQTEMKPTTPTVTSPISTATTGNAASGWNTQNTPNTNNVNANVNANMAAYRNKYLSGYGW